MWLAGDTRTLRPGAWIHFQDFAAIFGKKMPEEWTPLQVNFAQVERLVKRHLPDNLINRRVWAGELAEWNLINSGTTENEPKARHRQKIHAASVQTLTKAENSPAIPSRKSNHRH